jgi:hypothetical protein
MFQDSLLLSISVNLRIVPHGKKTNLTTLLDVAAN